MPLSDKMIALFAKGAVEDAARLGDHATKARKAALLAECRRSAAAYYYAAQTDVRDSGYRVTKRVRDIIWQTLIDIENSQKELDQSTKSG